MSDARTRIAAFLAWADADGNPASEWVLIRSDAALLAADLKTGASDGVRYWHARAEAAEEALNALEEEHGPA